MKINRREFAALSAAAAFTAAAAPFRAPDAWAIEGDAASFINPIIGASTSRKLGEGKTFPGAATPFGLVQLSPDTITGGDNGPGYSYDNPTIEGFSFTHMSGVGWYGDLGNLQVMPSTGPLRYAAGRVTHPGEGWRSPFRHASEVAKAGYYAVTLDKYDIRTELTAAPRTGMLRMTFPQSDLSRIHVDLGHRVAGSATSEYVEVVDPHSIEGWMKCTDADGGWGDGGGGGNYTVYFRMEFSRKLENVGIISIDLPSGDYMRTVENKEFGNIPGYDNCTGDYFSTADFYERVANAKVLRGANGWQGRRGTFFTEFATAPREAILVKAAISFVGIEGARKNLQRDIPGWDFDAVRNGAYALWNDALSVAGIDGATPRERAIFTTALYHASIDPRIVSDVDGLYTGADWKISRAAGYSYRTIFSGWDVFRAEFPLMTMLRPSMVNDEINTLIELARASGRGYLTRWEFLNSYSDVMDGDPATAVIVDAYAKGIRGFDAERAYAACRQTASGDDKHTNRESNGFYMKHGWVPGELSWTLDDAYFDWCCGRFAQLLGRDEDARMFFERSRNYRNVWDPAVGFMRAKDEKGRFIPWHGELDFDRSGTSESDPLQATWFAPHDVYGLIELMGAERFVGVLEDTFEKSPRNFGWNSYYNHANEPVHHMAYLFAYARKPWLTQKWVRTILNQAYHDGVDGICGNDDVGQMSAWYVISAFGFYQVCPGSNVYVIGAPLFRKATIQLDPAYYRGGSFTIVAPNNSPENMYVQSAALNGKPLDRAWVTHAEIVAGGTLEFTLGPKPNYTWGLTVPVPNAV
ncbi:MAG TPA: GH92 family glycosyl hydrolase [Candidatus Baltobacteraceae bacterium]|nr:GH92 family glycosyl hydrolase [Candidatus Baltobacteraceae bacterium]